MTMSGSDTPPRTPDVPFGCFVLNPPHTLAPSLAQSLPTSTGQDSASGSLEKDSEKREIDQEIKPLDTTSDRKNALAQTANSLISTNLLSSAGRETFVKTEERNVSDRTSGPAVVPSKDLLLETTPAGHKSVADTAETSDIHLFETILKSDDKNSAIPHATGSGGTTKDVDMDCSTSSLRSDSSDFVNIGSFIVDPLRPIVWTFSENESSPSKRQCKKGSSLNLDSSNLSFGDSTSATEKVLDNVYKSSSFFDSDVNQSSSSQIGVKNESERKKAKGKKRNKKESESSFPTHFLAIQITNPEIHENMNRIQDVILERSPEIKPAMIRTETLHITLFVMCLDPDTVQNAVSAIDEWMMMNNENEPLKLYFKGIGTFRNAVLFAKPVGDESIGILKSYAYSLMETFKKYGIRLKQEDLDPHLTIMKMSKSPMKLKKAGIKKIDPSLYEDQHDLEFGEQVCNSIQLCEMKGDKETKYYKIAHESFFKGTGNTDTEREVGKEDSSDY